MKSRLVDPVHFFNTRGKSILTQDHQEARIAELEAENERLRRIVAKTTDALKRLTNQNSPKGEIAN